MALDVTLVSLDWIFVIQITSAAWRGVFRPGEAGAELRYFDQPFGSAWVLYATYCTASDIY